MSRRHALATPKPARPSRRRSHPWPGPRAWRQTLGLGSVVLGSVLASVLGLSACAVGPDFQRPTPELPASLAPAELGAAASGVPASTGQAVVPNWWTQLGSDKLNRLVEQALAHNPSLAGAQAALLSAQESVRAQQGQYWPQVSAGYAFARQKVAGTLASPLSSNAYVFNLHTVNLDVGFTPDLFGLNRRTVEGLQAQADAQRWALEATRITLVSSVVSGVVSEAALREQVSLTRTLIALAQRQFDITQRLHALGAASESDVRNAESSLASADAALPPVLKALDQQRDALKALLGVYPSQVLQSDFTLDELHLPPPALSLPSALLERRPDILIAQENLHAASAAIGVARANRLPQITLGATAYGQTGTVLHDLVNSAGNFWALSGGLTAPLFSGGSLSARERAAQANYEQAAQLYRQTVLGAFQNVADALSAVAHDDEGLQRQQRASDAASRLLAIAQAQQQAGDLSALSLLPLQQGQAQARLLLLQAKATQLSDLAALYLALGDGWQGAQP